jgi:hypothetical protein
MDGRGLREVFMNEQRRIVDYFPRKTCFELFVTYQFAVSSEFLTDTVEIRSGSTASSAGDGRRAVDGRAGGAGV